MPGVVPGVVLAVVLAVVLTTTATLPRILMPWSHGLSRIWLCRKTFSGRFDFNKVRRTHYTDLNLGYWSCYSVHSDVS